MSMIPNPRKNVAVESTIAELKSALSKLPAYYSNKYSIAKKNELLNQFTFNALEFLSVGVYIDVNLNYISDNRTEIVVEVRRKIGAFDQWHEVQRANQHIANIFNGIEKLLAKVREINALNTMPVDVENPFLTEKYDGNWNSFKKQLSFFLDAYQKVYSLVSNSDPNEIVIRRMPQTGDDNYLEIDAIIKISPTSTEPDSCLLKYLITNEGNKISTQGELNRNNQVLKITTNLIQKKINELKIKLTNAESALKDVKKWKIGRSEKAKSEQIKEQESIVEELRMQLQG